MTKRFVFETLDLVNYRTFQELHARKFARVNLIGGLNGVGKTTLLEGLFAILNFPDPTNMFRPLLWRGMNAPLDLAARLTLGDRGTATKLRSQTRDGTIELTLTWEPQNLPSQVISRSATTSSDQKNVSTVEGLTVRANIDGQPREVAHLVDAGPSAPNQSNVAVTREIAVAVRMPPTALVSRLVAITPQEAAGRFSLILERGHKHLILALAQTLLPDCKNVELLQLAGVPQICGENKQGKFIPLSLLGEGASTIINIGLFLLTLQNGVILLDEFDTAIHYSKLVRVWRSMSDLASEVNCQIFAATHSRECIQAGANALISAHRIQDFAYFRLDLTPGGHCLTRYTAPEIMEAEDQSWDVR